MEFGVAIVKEDSTGSFIVVKELPAEIGDSFHVFTNAQGSKDIAKLPAGGTPEAITIRNDVANSPIKLCGIRVEWHIDSSG